MKCINTDIRKELKEFDLNNKIEGNRNKWASHIQILESITLRIFKKITDN